MSSGGTATPGVLAGAPLAPGDVGYRRRQLLWFTWVRLAVVTTALATALVVDLGGKPGAADAGHVRGLYVVLLAGYAIAAASFVTMALTRSDAVLAGVQFAGDLVLETGFFVVLVTPLDYDGAVAVVLPLFVLTTALACSYLDRLQGAIFATGAFLLQVVAHFMVRGGVLAPLGLSALPLVDAPLAQVVRSLFIIMFTFHATAWLLASRGERMRAMNEQLQSVSEDLAELQAFNELVVRGVSAALITTDGAGRITFLNDGSRALLGGDVRGQGLHDLLGWTERREEDLQAIRARAGATWFQREAVLDGRRLALEVLANRLEDRDGRVLGLLFLIEDRTEVRELEREVRLKEKMAVVGEMAAGIAHEIRNPLASISGSVQILQRQLTLAPQQQDLMRIVLEEARRLDGTIRDFLAFARPREPRRRAVDLCELIRETLLLLRHGDQFRPGHALRGPDAAEVLASCDPDQIRQVLWNLCQNGLKAMPDGGELAVTAGISGSDAYLCVEDQGTGMSEEMKERAFQPMMREFTEGTGLGLAIVYRIVHEHGGRVSLESTAGKGTRIEVRLPLAAPGSVATSTVRAPS